MKVVKKYFPKIKRKHYGALLMNATAFPFGSPKLILAQLKELSEKTDGTLGGAMAFAEAELDAAMES